PREPVARGRGADRADGVRDPRRQPRRHPARRRRRHRRRRPARPLDGAGRAPEDAEEARRRRPGVGAPRARDGVRRRSDDRSDQGERDRDRQGTHRRLRLRRLHRDHRRSGRRQPGPRHDPQARPLRRVQRLRQGRVGRLFDHRRPRGARRPRRAPRAVLLSDRDRSLRARPRHLARHRHPRLPARRMGARVRARQLARFDQGAAEAGSEIEVSAAAAHVVGVDIGTQSTKAVLCAADGTIVAQASRAYAVDTPQALWAEQRAEVWLVAVAQSVRELVERAGVAPGSIAGLCVSSLYGGSGIPVDGDGVPIHPCLIWMDRRAQEQVDRVRRSVDLDRLYDITGNGVDSYYGYTKMLWLRDERPEVWQRTHALLPPNSYVALQMTGEVAVDHSSAGNIGGIYDVARRSWSDEMLGALGIARSLLPDRLVDSSEVVGALRSAWADRLGLRAGTPVVAGGVDAAVATLAAGASRAGNHVALIGTSMCWGTIRQSVDARHGLISMPHVVNGKRDLYVFGGAITAGASVTWFRENFCHAEMAAGRARGVDPHELLEHGARAVAPGSLGLLFLPYLMGERSPIW